MHVELEALIGKPIVILKDGKKREVGTITHATYHHGGISFKGEITDDDLSSRLGALERKTLKIGGDLG